MVLATSPYHRVTRSAAERDIKLGAVALTIALHLVALCWLLRLHPVPAPTTDASMMLVEVQALAQRAVAPVITANRPRSEASHTAFAHAPAPRASNRRAADEGKLAPGAGILDASANGLGTAGSGSAAGKAGATMLPFLPPRVLHRGRADYPLAAFQAHAEGEAIVLVTIGADGSLIDARISTSSGNEALDRATLEAIRRYTYKAAEKGGNTIEAQAYVTLAWAITPALVERFRIEFPQDTREHDVVKAKQKVMLLSPGHRFSDN